MEDESWQDCVEACLGDRRFDILVPPAHYAAAKSAFVALKEKVGPISLLDTPGIRKANRSTDTTPADSLAAQVTSENPLAAQYADTILRRIVCCDTPDTLEHYPDSATRDLLRHHPFRLERLRTPQRYIGLDARRTRAEALKAELEALSERTRTADQTEKTLKAAYDQYQSALRGKTLEELAALWDECCRRRGRAGRLHRAGPAAGRLPREPDAAGALSGGGSPGKGLGRSPRRRGAGGRRHPRLPKTAGLLRS